MELLNIDDFLVSVSNETAYDGLLNFFSTYKTHLKKNDKHNTIYIKLIHKAWLLWYSIATITWSQDNLLKYNSSIVKKESCYGLEKLINKLLNPFSNQLKQYIISQLQWRSPLLYHKRCEKQVNDTILYRIIKTVSHTVSLTEFEILQDIKNLSRYELIALFRHIKMNTFLSKRALSNE